MSDMQDGDEEAVSLVRGRRDFRRGIIGWFLMLVCVGISAVLAGMSEAGPEEVLRVVLWLPVGLGIGVWAARCSTLARWTLSLAALVVFSLSVMEVVSAFRANEGFGEIVLGIAIIVLSFHVLRTMVWNRDAKAYALEREAEKPPVEE